MEEQNIDETKIMKLKAEIFDLMGNRDNTQVMINRKLEELQKILNTKSK